MSADRYRVVPARGYSTGWEVQDRTDPLHRGGVRHPTKREAQGVADALNAKALGGTVDPQ